MILHLKSKLLQISFPLACEECSSAFVFGLKAYNFKNWLNTVLKNSSNYNRRGANIMPG